MKYLCMFVAFKIKTNKSEKGEIRKNLTIMKTGKTELPRSTSGADEFFILQGKKQGVRIQGCGKLSIKLFQILLLSAFSAKDSQSE